MTRKQRQILEAVIYLVRQGEVPTVREIAALVGLRSPATVQKHLEALHAAGVIEMTGKSRGIRLVRGAGIPIVGRIAAGQPIESPDMRLADDTVADLAGAEGVTDGAIGLFSFEELPLDPDLFVTGTSPGEIVALRVCGDSMVNAGILDGDLVIVRRQPIVEEGEIAAVVIDGEGTLKRWHRSRGTGGRQDEPVRLTPENERFEAIEITAAEHRDVLVYGRYVGLIRGARRAS